MPDQEALMRKLCDYDTATITNVVATYPKKEDLCLGLYNPWRVDWYTDERIRCMYPQLGPRAGYAVTVRYALPDPAFQRLSFKDVLRAIDRAPKPVIVVMEQAIPEEIKRKNGLSGGNMTTAMKRAGAVGVVSDGPSRDIGEIREMDFQYLFTGVCAGHGEFQVDAVNVPVSVCGMDVCPGEIVHMDENGAVKFPAEYLAEVVRLAGELTKVEDDKMRRLRESNGIDELLNNW